MDSHSESKNREILALAPMVVWLPSARQTSLLRDLAAQALVGALALAQGFSVGPILYLSHAYNHSRTVLYGLLTLQWLMTTYVVRRPRSGFLSLLALCALTSLQYAPGAPAEFWPLWIASLFVPLAAKKLAEVSLQDGFVFGRGSWRSLFLGMSLCVYVLFGPLGSVGPWALVPTTLILALLHKSCLSLQVLLLVGALGLDVFTGHLWFMYGVTEIDVARFMAACLHESLEGWVLGFGFLSTMVAVMNHPRLGGMGARLWAGVGIHSGTPSSLGK